MPDLSITSVDAWNLKHPADGRSWSLVRLGSDSLEGWGECKPLTRESLTSLRAALQGAAADSYEALRVKLKSHPACAAVNMAALDLLGKSAKAPVYQVLGGPTRNSVRACTGLHGQTDEDILRSLDATRNAGHTAFAVNAPMPPFRNSGRALVASATRRMESLRRAGGDNVDFILNGAGGLTPGDAALLAAAFEHYHLLWFDEPCSTSSVGALRKVADENVTPIGFGQHAAEASFFQNLLREDAIDICRPELAIHGVSGIRKIAALAEVYYVAVAPRHAEGPVTTAAALHLAASLPNFFIQYIPSPASSQDRQMRSELTAGNIETVKDGYVQLPTQPGLGITINRAALSKYGVSIA